MAVEINSVPGFRLFAYFLSLLCSGLVLWFGVVGVFVFFFNIPLPNKKSEFEFYSPRSCGCVRECLP